MLEVRHFAPDDLELLLEASKDFFAEEGNPETLPLYFDRNKRLRGLLEKLSVEVNDRIESIRDKLEVLLETEDQFSKRGPRLTALTEMERNFEESARSFLKPTMGLVCLEDEEIAGTVAYHPVSTFMEYIARFSGSDFEDVNISENSGYIPFILSSQHRHGVGKRLLGACEILAGTIGHDRIYTHAWTGSYSPELFLSCGYRALDVVTGVSNDGAPSFLMEKEL